ncbi:MAG: hydrogenase [Verrucomicrobia bacterium]|nr:hydrogenase [Verrucomicrobiota bacterium]MBU4247642.1 hydrogenase [Verrucomicrobiota bacterium]MBU4292414.1 hydrogenase [Verrucomicrobiota bacterium]
MTPAGILYIHPDTPLALEHLPSLAIPAWRTTIVDAVARGGRIVALFGWQDREGHLQVTAVLTHAAQGNLAILSMQASTSYPTLTPDCVQAQGFERELAEQWGIIPSGHPWLKPLRFQAPFADARMSVVSQGTIASQPGVANFFKMKGEEIHEVAVGPVHAGIIEPGHFRFQCHGEQVFHLEIALGYQHRGVEPALLSGPDKRTPHLIETLAGDTTVGHATAYCQCLETLGGTRVPSRGQVLRGIALELERLANHTGDLGALSGDVGFLPTAAYCGRIRGDFLNMIALWCGNRFGRGLIRPGGVAYDLEPERVGELQRRLDQVRRDVRNAVDLLWTTPSVMARFEQTGTLSAQMCRDLGLVGPVARACGVERDVRYEFPFGIYCYVQIPVSLAESGDVFARATVRWLEIQRSLDFIAAQIEVLPEGPIRALVGELKPDAMTVSLVEGWRGEIAHVAMTDERGRFRRYKVVDPSFHNWIGLTLAMRQQPISDFPLCNKSFNLSYCGHDL